MIADHPDRERLQAYGQGRLAPEAATALEEHLAGCANCCEMLEQAPADSFLSRLRDAGSSAPSDPGRGTSADVAPDPAADTPPIPRELIDHPRYRVLGLVGQGGMGAVYRAEHRRMERLVALKVIRPGLMRNPAVVRRFHQEARAAARLHHANIVHAYDADQAGGLHFLVMEYVEGTSLAALVRQRGSLPVAEACEYVRQAALGLQHAHECGMVHRDITPHNLIVTADGHVKVLDFGLARLSLASDSPPLGGAATGPLTGAGAVMGTADYIAPEQAADPRAADIRADLYSLGCTLFYLLTGRPPFPDGTVAEKLDRHAAEPLPPISTLRPGVPAGLVAVLKRMTAKAPSRRYAAPAQVAEALAAFCPREDPPTQAVRNRRHRLGAALGLFTVLLLTAAIVIILGLRADHGEVVVRVETRGTEPTRGENTDTGRGVDGPGQTAKAPPQPPPEPRALTPEEMEDQAAEVIQKLGGKISRHEQAPGRPVHTISLADTKVNDADLRAMVAFTRLQNLDLSRTAVTDAGLEHLAGLVNLRTLNLTYIRATDAGMRPLERLRNLQSLDLQFTPIGDDGLRHLAGLTRLQTLRVYGPRVTDAGMAHVGRLTDLSELGLDDCEVTDQGMKQLSGLTGLTRLRLSSARRVGDEAMKTVGQFSKLQSLDIFGTAVTERGMKELAGLDQLTTLNLGKLKGADAGLRAFRDLSRLESLDLAYTDVTDEGLKVVAGCRRLWHLNLNSAKKVTDKGVKELAGLPRLKVLLLTDTGVTDDGIAELATCPRLASLILGKKSRVTEAGADKLRSALPRLRILR